VSARTQRDRHITAAERVKYLEGIIDNVRELAREFTHHPDGRVVRRGEQLLELTNGVNDGQ
jgi:hypothetical protein